MSFYAEYIREVSTDSIIETGYGFVTFRYLNDGKTVYVIEIYVAPEHRGSKKNTLLVDEVVKAARANGCSELLATIKTTNKYATSILKGHIAYGMTLHSAVEHAVVTRKDI